MLAPLQPRALQCYHTRMLVSVLRCCFSVRGGYCSIHSGCRPVLSGFALSLCSLGRQVSSS